MKRNGFSLKTLRCDVAIIGGGLAGANAAIGAAEKGADVIILDKGGIQRSGDIGGGVDHFLAYLESGEEWDTRESYLEYVKKIAHGAVRIDVHEAVFCEELKAALKRMERINNPLSRSDGSYYRTQSLGQPGPYWINFNGKRLKPKLANEAARLKSHVLEKVATTTLLHDQDGVYGLIAISLREPVIYLISAGAVVLSTGNTNRLFKNPHGNPFNSWLCPVDTGDAQVMAYEAGAELANMEYIRMTVVPKGFSAPGTNAYFGMGCRLVNADGEEFMHKYHHLNNKAPRWALAEGILNEKRLGKGPVYIDCRSLSPSDLDHLKQTLGYDKDTLPDFLEQKGIKLERDLLEVTVSEGMQAGPSEVVGSGIYIDENCRSKVPGLFAAGDCADQTRCAHMAVTSGYRAGVMAYKEAQKGHRKKDLPTSKKIFELLGPFLTPLNRNRGIIFSELEEELRAVMWEFVGANRNERGLKKALGVLNSLKEKEEQLYARNLHELSRTIETRNLITIGILMTTAALFRCESRFGVYHCREDYPESDDEKWLGQVVLSQSKNSNPKVNFYKLS